MLAESVSFGNFSQNRVFTSWTSMTLTGYSNYGWIDSDTPRWAWFAWRVEVSLSWRAWALPAGGHGSTSTQMSFWSVCLTIGQASARKERMVGWEVEGQMARQRLQWQVAVSFVWDLDEDLQNPTRLQLQPFFFKKTRNFYKLYLSLRDGISGHTPNSSVFVAWKVSSLGKSWSGK